MSESTKTGGKKVIIYDLEKGMKLARDVEYKYGSIIIPAGTILDKYKIERLKKMGLRHVYIYDEDQQEIAENIDKIESAEQNYEENVDEVGTLFKRVKHKRKISTQDVREITTEVITLGDDRQLVDLLTRVREADQYTHTHLMNVGILAYMFGNWLDFSQKRALELAQAGLLHDIGKAYIPEEILNKPCKLTKKEFAKMKKHPLHGYKIAREMENLSEETRRGILTHHERYNGSGYPLQLQENKIPLFGRILAIIDTFDAITSERVYQSSSSPFEAIKLFKEESLGAFDYTLVNIFVKKIPDFFVNEKVILNDGREAEVVFINPLHPDKPIIKVDDNYVDLYNNDRLEIAGLVEEYSDIAENN